jgi:hypothetical protein
MHSDSILPVPFFPLQLRIASAIIRLTVAGNLEIGVTWGVKR